MWFCQWRLGLWLRAAGTLWYFPLIHWLLPRCLPLPAVCFAVPTPVRLFGNLLSLFGAGMTAWSIYEFIHDGHGTPAPFDPPERLVVKGPYKFCRNPMEQGNMLTLLGRALANGCPRTGMAGLLLGVGHHGWFLVVEEPGLQRRFGSAYKQYQRRVPRWGWHMS